MEGNHRMGMVRISYQSIGLFILKVLYRSLFCLNTIGCYWFSNGFCSWLWLWGGNFGVSSVVNYMPSNCLLCLSFILHISLCISRCEPLPDGRFYLEVNLFFYQFLKKTVLLAFCISFQTAFCIHVMLWADRSLIVLLHK